ncbi:MAG: hypothetical protein ACFB15_16360 [Cyclobacteriaceae bacterium]
MHNRMEALDITDWKVCGQKYIRRYKKVHIIPLSRPYYRRSIEKTSIIRHTDITNYALAFT